MRCTSNVTSGDAINLRDGNGITLEQMLVAREQRVLQQQALLVKCKKPVVSLTLVIPGEIKNSSGARFLFDVAVQSFESLCKAHAWTVLTYESSFTADTGPEALWVVDAKTAQAAKQATLLLEESHALGRLWDFDVISPLEGALSRRVFNIAPRRCLICDEAAHACARARKHSTDDLLTYMESIVNIYRAK